MLLILFFPLLVVQPVFASSDCSGVTIDNDTSDWDEIDAILTDDQDLEDNTYYYNGMAWSTMASGTDLYSTNIQGMQDLEKVKVCNSAVELQVYIDTYHPLLS